MFNAEEFLSTAFETKLDDKFNQVDEGEYNVNIGVGDKDIEVKKGEKDGKPWAQAAVRYEILDPTGEIEKKLGRKPTITHYFFLDVTPDGKLDTSPQKNVRLGQLLTATGLNGSRWSFTALKGKQIKIKVAKVKNNMNPSEPRSEVVMVGLAS